MGEEIMSELDPWKKKKFRISDVRLDDAGASVCRGKAPLVEARPTQGAPNQWCLYNTKTNNVAVLTHALVYNWGSPTETGNFVPDGEDPHPDLPINRIYSFPSNFCELSFAFDTSGDMSLYEHLKTLETLVESNKEFNRHGKPYRNWQSPDNSATNHRYVASAKVFMRKTTFQTIDKVPYKPHPWLQTVAEDPSSRWLPNKERPSLYHYQPQGKPRFLPVEYGTGGFQKGDIIWISFIVTFNMRPQGWSSAIIPLDLIRVGKIEALPTAKEVVSSQVVEKSDHGPLCSEEIEVDDEVPLSDEGSVGKRKRGNSDTSDNEGNERDEGGSSTDGELIDRTELAGVEKDVAMMEIDDNRTGTTGGEPSGTKRRAVRSTRRA